MDFRLSPELETFREEVRAFLRAELPLHFARGEGETVRGDNAGFYRAFTRKLVERGWLTLAWPKEHGGQGARHLQQAVYNEEMTYAQAPMAGIGVDRVGPTLMLYGTEEQRRAFLPPIARGQVVWCQGFSEPGAGSDLASLQTRAVRDGDEYIVNGSKIWTSLAHRADWMILLARTDPYAPKHRGISYFLLDMKTPGITVRPLIDLTERHAFNQVFFEDVRIPKERLVGEENRGWYVAAATLDFERSGIHRVVAGRRWIEELIAFIREAGAAGVSPRRDATVRARLADLCVAMEVGRWLAYRVAWAQEQGRIPNVEASVSKLYGSELQQRIAGVGLTLLGLGGQLAPGSRWAPLAGRLERYYRWAVSLTVGAGTSEVNRNIIATRGLGLPRG